MLNRVFGDRNADSLIIVANISHNILTRLWIAGLNRVDCRSRVKEDFYVVVNRPCIMEIASKQAFGNTRDHVKGNAFYVLELTHYPGVVAT